MNDKLSRKAVALCRGALPVRHARAAPFGIRVDVCRQPQRLLELIEQCVRTVVAHEANKNVRVSARAHINVALELPPRSESHLPAGFLVAHESTTLTLRRG